MGWYSEAYFSRIYFKKETFIATLVVLDLGIDFSRSVVYASNGYKHKHDLYLVAFKFIVNFIGTVFG